MKYLRSFSYPNVKSVPTGILNIGAIASSISKSDLQSHTTIFEASTTSMNTRILILLRIIHFLLSAKQYCQHYLNLSVVVCVYETYAFYFSNAHKSSESET